MSAAEPSKNPTVSPSSKPTVSPSANPTRSPSSSPSVSPTTSPSASPSGQPSEKPSEAPSALPSQNPSSFPSTSPSETPSSHPSTVPSEIPSSFPSDYPSLHPSDAPSQEPSFLPSFSPTNSPEHTPTTSPTKSPEASPTDSPIANPTSRPSKSPSIIPSQSPIISCGTRATKVKIESTTGQNIHVIEVQVYEDGVNVAIGKQATQSSTFKTFDASRAIDGSPTTFSNTAAGDSSPWWEVDLGRETLVEYVQILNRYCIDPSDPGDCLCRLSNATLSLLDKDHTYIATKSLADTCGILNTGISFSDDFICPQKAFVVNSVDRTSSNTNKNIAGSTINAIVIALLGAVLFAGLAIRTKKQQQQRQHKFEDQNNFSPFVTRRRSQRSLGLHRKASGQQVLDQLEDNSLIVNVKSTQSGGWNCTFDEHALAQLELRTPSVDSVESRNELEEIERSIHNINSEEETYEELVIAMHDAMNNNIEPSNEATALAEKYSIGELDEVVNGDVKMPSLGHDIT